jgi:hypothetical protein
MKKYLILVPKLQLGNRSREALASFNLNTRTLELPDCIPKLELGNEEWEVGGLP